MEAFCHGIVQATHSYAAAFKPNLAFFEQYGAAGWAALERIIAGMPEDVLVIADAKRGDIGNTAKRYAKAMFDGLGAHAITVAPTWARTVWLLSWTVMRIDGPSSWR